MLNPQDPMGARAGDADGEIGRRRGTAVDLEKQAPRWPGQETGGGTWGMGEHQGDGQCNEQGDILVLDTDQRAVQRKVRGAPAFDKQVGWREVQAADALESNER
ncbi:unnamed protein product, partial [Hapterophycus canaliculatus]